MLQVSPGITSTSPMITKQSTENWSSWWICWTEFCQVALTQSERSNIPCGKGDSRMYIVLWFNLWCFYVSFVPLPSSSWLVCHGLSMFAKWHVSTSGMMQGCSGKQPKNLVGFGPKCSIIMRSVGNRIIKSLKRAKRLRFIQTFIRTFTTWVTLEFSEVKRREKSVYISTGMYKYLHKYLQKLYQREPQIATNETSKLQTLHCSPSKAGATNLCEFVAFGHQLCFFKDLSRSEFGPTLYCQNLLNATRSDAMMAGQHSWQHIR